MSLISCPECSQQVSSSAPKCPKCGHPIAGVNGTPAVILLLGIIFTAFLWCTPFGQELPLVILIMPAMAGIAVGFIATALRKR